MIRFVSFPPSVEFIGSYSFNYCHELRRIKFHDKSRLHTIGKGAFAGTNLRVVSFPKSLVIIESNAFSLCKLQRVYFPEESNLKFCADDAFDQQIYTNRLIINAPW